MKKADIGLIGLAVMGENLVMNMESRGYTVSVFNRTADKVPILSKAGEGEEHSRHLFPRGLVASLERPGRS
jgi:6-phosphogluconate dehydrogenase